MADAATATGSDTPAGETPTQRQARLRREKRQKKMAESGEDRLAKIKALNGGVAPPAEILGGPTSPVASVAGDPDEVDISSLSSTSRNRTGHIQDMPSILQMQQPAQGHGSGARPSQAQAGGEEDPMVKMMQQMMGMMGQGQPQDSNNPNAQPEMPQMLQALMSGQQGQQQEQATPAARPTYLWKIAHAIFALILATYIALTSTFNGTALSRSQSVYTAEAGYGLGPRLFTTFITAELLLQSIRYYADGGRLPGNGMFAMVANSGMIPPPYGNYLLIAGRYVNIAQTVFKDAMMVVFVLGCLAWWSELSTSA